MKTEENHMVSAVKLVHQFVPGFFPSLIKVLAGTKGQGIAKHLVSIARGITGESNMGRVYKKLAQNPQALAHFQKEALRYERQIYQDEKIDFQSARRRDLVLQQHGRSNRRADFMVLAAGLGLLSCLMFLIFYRRALSAEAVTIVSAIAGIFGSCLKDAYAFEFGASRSSTPKDVENNPIPPQSSI
jgi:hypothetical protein